MSRLLASWLTVLCCLPAIAQDFSSARVLPVDGDPQVLVTADLNRDGTPDLVYADAGEGGNLHVLLGAGDGSFTTGPIISLPDAVGTTITIADLNGDGIPDLLLGYDGTASPRSGIPFSSPCVSVFLGRGDGSFDPRIANPISATASPTEINQHMAVADFDGDGLPADAFSDATTI